MILKEVFCHLNVNYEELNKLAKMYNKKLYKYMHF